MSSVRRIFRSSSTSSTEVRELLESLFAAELLLPSRCLWLVSPWLSDLVLLDNRTGAFAAFNPQWGPRKISLSALLGHLLELGTQIIVATRPVPHNETLLRKLDDLAHACGAVERLTIHRRELLHLKGFLGDDFYLSGSMNFTFNGVEILEEGIVFETDREATENARIAFLQNYGGPA